MLAKSGLAADYDSVAGTALIRLAGRLWFFAHGQVRWWEKVPPWRWMRRGTKVRAYVSRHLDGFLAGAFGEHNVATTRADAIIVAGALVEEHRLARKQNLAGRRRAWALELVRAPIAGSQITSDTELLANSDERVLSAEEYDGITTAGLEGVVQRDKLVAAADRAHKDLVA